MNWRKLRSGIGIFLLICGLVCLVWGLWPIRSAQRLVDLPAGAIDLTQQAGPQAVGIPRLAVSWPSWIQVGRVGRVSARLGLFPNDQAEASSSGGGTEERWGIEARLELPGVQMAPTGTIRQALIVDRPVEFAWEVQAYVGGDNSGSIWLYLTRAATEGEVSRQLLSVQPVKINVGTLFGFAGYTAQVLGVVLAFCGLALMIDWIYNWLADPKRHKHGKMSE